LRFRHYFASSDGCALACIVGGCFSWGKRKRRVDVESCSCFYQNLQGHVGDIKTVATPFLSVGAFHWIRRQCFIRGFTFQPADFGKNRNSPNERNGRI
jgi:hypothetical protein